VLKLSRLIVVWLAVTAAVLVAAIVTNAAALYVVFLLSVFFLVGGGMSPGVIRGGSDHRRKGEVIRQNFPARKRFEDKPAEYDEAAWAAYKARLAELERDS
jgi:uncharacterized protein (DUF58 family)